MLIRTPIWKAWPLKRAFFVRFAHKVALLPKIFAEIGLYPFAIDALLVVRLKLDGHAWAALFDIAFVGIVDEAAEEHAKVPIVEAVTQQNQR